VRAALLAAALLLASVGLLLLAVSLGIHAASGLGTLAAPLPPTGEAARRATPAASPSQADAPSTPAPLSMARPPPLPARLVFAQDGNLWVLERSDARPRRLTDLPDGGYLADPALSPDRRLVAYARLTRPADPEQPSTQDLYLVSADGTGERRLVAADRPEATVRAPAWAPDGQSLYFVYQRDDASRIERVAPDGSARAHVREPAGDLAVSPDGRWLAHVVRDARGLRPALVAASLDGSTTRTLVPSGTFVDIAAPRYAPSGRTLAFGAATAPAAATPSAIGALRRWIAPVAEAHGIPWDVWQVDADGGGLRRLTDLSEDLIVPAWSPDERWIGFSAEGGVYALSLDQRRVYRLVDGLFRGGVDWLP
jgi:Tol biopolymer transport system component